MDAANDLLISDDLEVDGDAWFDGNVTITGTCTGCGGSSFTGEVDDATNDALTFTSDDASPPAGTVNSIFRDNTGDLNINTVSGKTLNLQIAGADEYNLSATALAMNGNNITGLGTALTAAAGLTVTATSADLALATATSGNITLAPASTGSVQLTSGVTTGTTTTSGLSMVANSLTTGTGLNISSTSLSSGSLVNLAVSGTAGASSQKVINVSTTGAITGTQTTYGGFFSNTHSGGTSTNIGLYATATGGTNNYAAIFEAGNVGIGTTTPTQKLAISDGVLLQDYGTNSTPTTLGGVDFANYINNTLIVGKFAYVSVGPNAGTCSSSVATGCEFRIYDVSNPNTTPIYIGGLNTALDSNTYGVAKFGKYVYLGTPANGGGNEVLVVDVSNPTSPTVVGGLEISTDVHSISVYGKYLYVGNSAIAGTGCSTSDASGCEFRIYNISNPTTPVFVGGTNYGVRVSSILIQGKYAYTVMDSVAGNDFRIVDISSPTAPTDVGGVDMGVTGRSLIVSGIYAYIGTDVIAGTCNSSTPTGCEFRIYQVSDPATPVFIGGFSNTSNLISFDVVGKYAYIGFGSIAGNDLAIYDLSTLSAPTAVGGIDFTAAPVGIKAVGKYLYVGVGANISGNDFRIFDITGIDAPSASIGTIASFNVNIADTLQIGNSAYIHNSLNVGEGGIYSGGPISIQSASTSSGLFAFEAKNSAGLSLLSVRDDGSVGIGTSAPENALDINSATGANLQLTYNDTDGSAANKVNFGTTSSGDLTVVPSGGDIGLTGTLSISSILQVGSATPTTYSRLGTGTTGHTLDAANDLLISDDLEVDGDAWFDGNVTITGTCTGCGGSSFTGEVDDATNDALTFTSDDASPPAGTVNSIFRDNTGDLNINTVSGKTLNLQIAGADEYNLSATALAMNGNNITGLGTALTAAAGLTVTATSADLALATATSGNITLAPASTGSVQLTSGVTTGTTTTSGLSMVANSLTTGTGLNISSTSLSSGSLVNLAVSGTAGASSQKVINVSTTGAITGTQTTYGGFFSNTHSGGTSTNIGLYATATGGTNNYAAIFEAGNVGIGDITPDYLLDVAGNVGIGDGAANAVLFSNSDATDYLEFVHASRAINLVSGGFTFATLNGTASVYDVNSQNANLDFRVRGQTENNLIFADASANAVGISIGAPTSLLHIQQAVDATGTTNPIALDVNSSGSAGELTASSGSQIFTRISPVVNQTSTASYRALDINVTETAVTNTSGLNRLVDLRVGSSSKLAIANNGSITLQNASSLVTPNQSVGTFQNHLVRSDDFGTTWTVSNVSAITNDTQVAPDGSTSAESLATSSSGGYVQQDTSTAATSVDYTLSVWVKSTGTQNFSMRIDGTTGGTGTEVTHTATTSWQRFSVTQTLTGAFTGNVRVRIYPGTSAGTGTVYAWGAQLEKTSTPNAYARTTGAALTNNNRGTSVYSNLDAATGFTYGNRNIINISTGSNVDATYIGQFIRVIDNDCTADCDNTTKGLEVQAFSGTNLAGTNIGVDAYGYTFGVKGTTTGQASNVAQPAAVFADLDNGSATTTGNAIRAYTDNATSADLVSLYQETSAYTGNGLELNFGNGAGSFSGNFISLQKAGTQSFHVDDDGSTFVSFTGTGTAHAVCHATNGNTNDDELVDCNAAPAADYAEMYPVDSGIDVGDIVVTGTEMVNTYNGNEDGGINWNDVKGQITKLKKSNTGYQSNVIGIVSDNYYDFISTGYNIKPQDNPKSVALNGRVLVKVTNENGSIKAGDYITTSKIESGFGAKATRSGQVVGQALGDINFENGNTGLVMVFVKVGYQSIGNTIVLDAPSINSTNLQSGDEDLTSNNASTFVIQQQSSEEESETVSNILQLQTGDQNRFMVSSTGATSILSNLNCELDEDVCPSVLNVTQGSIELMNIDARGTLALTGTIIIKDDSFAGSIVTEEDGMAEITFNYHLGTGKPVVQLTAEAQIPVFAQIVEFKQDEDGNYTGFVMKTFDLLAGPIQATVHYTVTGKQEGYITLGDAVVPSMSNPGDGFGIIIDGGEVIYDGGDGPEDPIDPDDLIDNGYPPDNESISGVIEEGNS